MWITFPEAAAKYWPPFENFTKVQFLKEFISLKLLTDSPSFCKLIILSLSEYATAKWKPEGWKLKHEADSAYDLGVSTVISS
jgi:hypothetical protein